MSERKPDLQLFLLHRAALIDYAAPILGCRARAEDVVQEAWLRFTAAGDRRDTGEAIQNPVGYLYRIVRNLAFDGLRSTAREASSTGTEGMDRLIDESAAIEQSLLYRDELRLLGEALSDLPERTRLAFTLYRLEGRTLQEVADHLGVSVVRAHQLVKEALLHAARRLDRPDA